VLDDKSLVHGPLECLFTVSEETGLDGARAVAPGFIKGSILINLDSEDEGEVFIGCAGGIDTTARFSYEEQPAPKEGITALKVSLTGATGGHSGDEIHKDLCNAVQVLARFLWNAQQQFSFDIGFISGGNKRNAIAREAVAVCLVQQTDRYAFTELFQTMASEWKAEYKHTDPELESNGQKNGRKPDGFTVCLSARCPCHEQGYSRIGGNIHQPGFSPDGSGKQGDPHWQQSAQCR